MEIIDLINNLKSGIYKFIKIQMGDVITIRRIIKIKDGKIYSKLDGTEIVIIRPFPKHCKLLTDGYEEVINLGKFGKKTAIVKFLKDINKVVPATKSIRPSKSYSFTKPVKRVYRNK